MNSIRKFTECLTLQDKFISAGKDSSFSNIYIYKINLYLFDNMVMQAKMTRFNSKIYMFFSQEINLNLNWYFNILIKIKYLYQYIYMFWNIN